MSDTTHLSEMAVFFPVGAREEVKPQSVVIRPVPPRFWQPGDTHEQALARQQKNMKMLKAKVSAVFPKLGG